MTRAEQSGRRYSKPQKMHGEYDEDVIATNNTGLLFGTMKNYETDPFAFMRNKNDSNSFQNKFVNFFVQQNKTDDELSYEEMTDKFEKNQ